MVKKVTTQGQKTTADMADVDRKVSISSKVIVEDEHRRRRLQDVLPKMGDLKALMDRVTERISDNRGMMELLPDLILAKRILVSSILSPKDLVAVQLRLHSDEGELDDEVRSEVLDYIEEHFRTTFPLEERLTKILEDCLFETGSYALAVIPETTLESLVAQGKIGGMESFNQYVRSDTAHLKSVGIIRANKEIGNLTITDNLSALKLNTVRRQLLTQSIRSKVSMEAYRHAPVVKLTPKQGGTKETRNPLVMKVPSEAIIPVHVPGDPRDHLGYYLAVNENGMPVSMTSDSESGISRLRERIMEASNNQALGGLIQATGLSLGTTKGNKVDPDTFIDQYINYIEKELTDQLKDGVYGEEVEVSRPEEVYRLMLGRVLAQKRTRIVYIPKELMTYFAFNYDEYGLGISLLEKTRVFGSLRAVLLFAEVMAGVKNSVGRTRLNVTLDEDDPDPQATLEAVLHQYANLQVNQLPIGILNPSDIVRSLQKAAVDINVDGGEAFPNTNTEIEDRERQRAVPDSQLSETLRRMQYSGLGIPPEIVDSTMEGELATVVVSRNLMFAKQVMDYQRWFETQLKGFIQTYVWSSGELLTKIRDSVKAKGDTDVVVAEFIEGLNVSLPSPDLAKIGSQFEAFSEYSDAIDRVVEAYITEDMIAELLDGDVNSRALDSMRVSVASTLKRDWMRRQNLFVEVDEFFNDEDNKPSKRITDHTTFMVKALGDILAKTFKEEKKVREKIDKATAEPEPEPTDMGGDPNTDDAGLDTGDDAVGDTEGGLDEGDAAADDAEGDGEGEDTAGGDDDGDLDFNF